MNANSELHLILPGVCGPLAEIQSLKNNPVIKHWIKTLSKSHCSPAPENMHGVITSLFKLSDGVDIPTAALIMLANDMVDTALHYMHADPVHLRADLDHAVLTSSADLAISDTEADVLCEALNQHFNEDGLNFFRIDKNQWFVSSKKKIQMNTTSLVEATGRNINFLLPQGPGSSNWKQRLTEAQMLLHAHDININRENTGQQSINSLWFHGSGEQPVLNESVVTSVCSDDDLFKGLASLVKCDYLEVPDSVSDYTEHLLSRNNNAVHVFHLSELEHSVNYTDVSLWLDKLTDVLTDWVYPLIKVANKHNIKIVLYPCNAKQYQFTKYDLFKFWHQGTLEQHISSYSHA
jgi:hypothetical protein